MSTAWIRRLLLLLDDAPEPVVAAFLLTNPDPDHRSVRALALLRDAAPIIWG